MEFTKQDEAIGLIYESLRLNEITKIDAINLLSDVGITKIKARQTVDIWERYKCSK